ncbi:MAG: RNA-directed DNA polymerase [Saprospiraceae bacterium]|jgi:RNA-directed DNA polymerase
MIGIRSYGRYVDDFVIVLEDKSLLKELISTLGNFLNNELHLTLHPKKIYLQHYSKDVPFLGTMIKPGRIYIGKRTKSNFYQAIQKQNAIVRNRKPTKEEQLTFQSSMFLVARNANYLKRHRKESRYTNSLKYYHPVIWWIPFFYLLASLTSLKLIQSDAEQFEDYFYLFKYQ